MSADAPQSVQPSDRLVTELVTELQSADTPQAPVPSRSRASDGAEPVGQPVVQAPHAVLPTATPFLLPPGTCLPGIPVAQAIPLSVPGGPQLSGANNLVPRAPGLEFADGADETENGEQQSSQSALAKLLGTTNEALREKGARYEAKVPSRTGSNRHPHRRYPPAPLC